LEGADLNRKSASEGPDRSQNREKAKDGQIWHVERERYGERERWREREKYEGGGGASREWRRR
jgi:hypothetical protein